MCPELTATPDEEAPTDPRVARSDLEERYRAVAADEPG